jgi:hypothetical protein
MTLKTQLTYWVECYKDVAERNALAETPKESAEYLLSLILSEIDKAALTEEQIKDATDYDVLCCDGCYKITENMTTAEADIYCQTCCFKAVAAAQLEAIKNRIGEGK